MKKILWLFFLCIIYSANVIAQRRICECAPFFSPLASDDFESSFPPSLIRAKRISEVTVLISSSQRNGKNKNDTTFKVIDQQYTEETFAFNKDGYVVSGSTFYFGTPNYYYTYKRDNKNGIIQFTSEFFDSTGKISSDSKPEITDYTLNENGNILKRKKRDFNGTILPDEKSEYTITEYDKRGWKLKETTHFYWDWEKQPHSYNTTYYTYLSKGKTGIAKEYINKKFFLTTTTNYDDDGKPLNITSFNHFMNKSAHRELFKYDSLDRLIKYIQTTGGGGGSECPGKGNFSNEFKYGADGLLIEQRHKYANIVCLLQFEYK